MAYRFGLVLSAESPDIADKYRFLVDIGEGETAMFKFDHDPDITEIAEAAEPLITYKESLLT